ncbi:hypothetical protein HDU67_005389, partial [Dinochytrium kinnereticum]
MSWSSRRWRSVASEECLPPPVEADLRAQLFQLLEGHIHVDPSSLPVPDPSAFEAGGVNSSRWQFWDEVLAYSPEAEAARIGRWIRHGVTVEEFLNPRGFSGTYKGVRYSSLLPPRQVSTRSTFDPVFLPFVTSSFEDDVRSGARVYLSMDSHPPAELWT